MPGLLLRTRSLCPVCLRRVDACYEDDGGGGAILRKSCPEHGEFSVPAWTREEGDGVPEFSAWLRPRRPSHPDRPRTDIAGGCPYDCGLCPRHAQHTCTALVEITGRCNLRCPVCYADAGGEQDDPPLENLIFRLDALRGASPGCNLQLSGGEPTLRGDLPGIIRAARERRFGLIQINSNGLLLAGDPGLAPALRAAGLDSVYLQCDSVHDAHNSVLRGRPILETKAEAIRRCAGAGLGVVLVATVVRGVNDGALGDLLRWAVSLGAAVRGLHIQPASSFGRFPWTTAEAPRLTLPDVMRALARQAPEWIDVAHFHPPGCEHALCSFSTVYARTPAPDGGTALRWIPGASSGCRAPSAEPSDAAEGARISRGFTAGHWKAPESPSGASLADAFGRFMADAGADRRFTLSCMAFQDVLSLDLERTRGCCIHVVRTDGRMIPFCLHNMTSAGGVLLHGGRNG